MIYPAIHTCRICHGMMRYYEGIKYSIRHYAHFECYLDDGRSLADLHNWQIEGFPFRLIHEKGLMDEVERLTADHSRVVKNRARGRVHTRTC